MQPLILGLHSRFYLKIAKPLSSCMFYANLQLDPLTCLGGKNSNWKASLEQMQFHQCSLNPSCTFHWQFFICLWLNFSKLWLAFTSIQFSHSVVSNSFWVGHPMNHSTPSPPVHHQLPEFIQTHVHQVSDAIQPSHPLSSPSPPAPN